MYSHQTTLIKCSVFLLCLVFLTVHAKAQHCPYDGGNMIVVQLTDEHDTLLANAADRLSLREIDNPKSDSCAFAGGLITLPFRSPLEAFVTQYERQGAEAFQRYCADCSFTGEGYYAVILGQAEQECMIPTKGGSDYTYVPRKYEVRYTMGTTVQSVKIPKDRIYSMCTNNGKWSRIEPVKLRLNR